MEIKAVGGIDFIIIIIIIFIIINIIKGPRGLRVCSLSVIQRCQLLWTFFLGLLLLLLLL